MLTGKTSCMRRHLSERIIWSFLCYSKRVLWADVGKSVFSLRDNWGRLRLPCSSRKLSLWGQDACICIQKAGIYPCLVVFWLMNMPHTQAERTEQPERGSMGLLKNLMPFQGKLRHCWKAVWRNFWPVWPTLWKGWRKMWLQSSAVFLLICALATSYHKAVKATKALGRESLL